MKKKVLMINWGWYPTGGDWTYVENLKNLYEVNGYEVIPFSTVNEKNYPTPYNKYFVTGFDYKQLNRNKNFSNGFKALKNAVVSKEALQKIEILLQEHTINIAHLHNIHHYLTPAIVWKLKQKNIKVVWTLHDYKIICPENSFVSNGKICEKCMSGNFYECTINKCKKNSLAASSLASIEAYYYHSTKVYKQVDAYLCPSEFLHDKFLQFGFEPAKLFVTNYCYDSRKINEFLSGFSPSAEERQGVEKFILYVGRIEHIKGVKTLIDSVSETGILLKIAGTGTALEELKNYVTGKAVSNIEFLGFQEKLSIYKLTLAAQFVICPSEWYENYPFSIIESLLLGKPVIGSRIGGIPELVIDGKTGLLFEKGNVLQLREKINELWSNHDLRQRLGSNAKTFVENKVDFTIHWTKLNAIINN